MSVDQYVLLREEQDKEAAFRWNSLNEIRKSKASVQDKILKYFRANIGSAITGEELRYLAGDKNEWPRRVRELRTELGWPIVTRMQGRPDLPVGVYVLEEDKQAPEHDRRITDGVRAEVLTRDGFSCKVCGWKHADIVPSDPRKLLELHHILEHVRGGKNEADNLVTL